MHGWLSDTVIPQIQWVVVYWKAKLNIDLVTTIYNYKGGLGNKHELCRVYDGYIQSDHQEVQYIIGKRHTLDMPCINCRDR